MNKIIYFFLPVLFATNLVLAVDNSDKSKDPKQLIVEVVSRTGSYEKLSSLVDVAYTYTTSDSATGAQDISKERYIFNGELSWAKYVRHEMHVFPDKKGEIIQGYNGKESWITIDGKLIDDPMAIKLSDFLRKTNFYWFAMMQKLLDPGINYSYEGTKLVNGINYELVKITFETGVGDVSDTYLLYINPNTKLVDQFLFTVMDFNITDPYLMLVEYEQMDGIKLPVKRKLIKSNWNGDLLEDNWMLEIMSDIKFDNGFKKEDFDKPNK